MQDALLHCCSRTGRRLGDELRRSGVLSSSRRRRRRPGHRRGRGDGCPPPRRIGGAPSFLVPSLAPSSFSLRLLCSSPPPPLPSRLVAAAMEEKHPAVALGFPSAQLGLYRGARARASAWAPRRLGRRGLPGLAWGARKDTRRPSRGLARAGARVSGLRGVGGFRVLSRSGGGRARGAGGGTVQAADESGRRSVKSRGVGGLRGGERRIVSPP